MKSLLALPKEVQDEIQANMRQVTDRMAMADIGAVLKFLDGEPVRIQDRDGGCKPCRGQCRLPWGAFRGTGPTIDRAVPAG